MKIFVLMFYLWTPSAHAGGTVTMHDFGSEAACRAAGNAAENKFGGVLSQSYWVCIPRDSV